MIICLLFSWPWLISTFKYSIFSIIRQFDTVEKRADMIRYSNLFIIIIYSSLILPYIQGVIGDDKVKSSRKNVPGKIEIRAIMVNCQPKMFPKVGGASRKHCDNERASSELAEFHGFDTDEISLHSRVKNCNRKLVITMRLKNDRKTVTEEQFVVVDHVYDPVFKKRARLLNPFVFKIKQNQVLQLYGLQFQNIVNAEVTEEVINKNLDNFTGCDTSSSHPTCGFSLSNKREVIPYSEGFCCSCDAYVNSQRQPHTGYTTFRSLHQIGPSPMHVKSHRLPFTRHNRDTLDYDVSRTKSNSNQKTCDGSNAMSEQMQSIGIQDRLKLSVTNDHSTIPFKGPKDNINLLPRGNTQVELDGDYSSKMKNSIDLISSNKGIHEENEMKSATQVFASTSSYLSNDFENTCNRFENLEKSSKQGIKNIYDTCDFSSENREEIKDQINFAHNRKENTGFPRLSPDENLNNGYKFVDCNLNSTMCLQQRYQSHDTDSLENDRIFTRRLLSKCLQETDSSTLTSVRMDVPLTLDTVVSFDDDGKNTKTLSHTGKSAKKNIWRIVPPNSILNSHDDLKPVSVSKIDKMKSNSVRTSTANNLNMVPILEHPNPMEPAIGFKKSDLKLSDVSPWHVHNTECPRSRNRHNTSKPHNKYLHYLKFEGDSDAGDVAKMEHLKEVVQFNRLTAKLAGIELGEESGLDKASLQKRNTSRSFSAKFDKDNETSSEIQSRRKKINVKRQASPNGNQIRGGQSCVDRSTPPGLNPIAYHESAHCLRFSELWYTVYKLKQPFVEHSLHLKLFEKYDYHDKNTHWDEITARSQTNLGTFKRLVQDEKPIFAFTYMPSSEQPMGPFQLDTEKSTLLVPQPVSENLQDKYPQAKAGPSEYLLLKSDQISVDGEECDKVGVSFAAFAKQSDRCGRVRGTCLENQPLHLWQHDHELLAQDKPGKYFLKNFACISTNPFLVNISNSDEFLAIEYHNPYSATIEIEVASDFNVIIRPGIGAQIPEVYVDATCGTNTKIIVTIANMGLASSRFFSRLANCPGGLPEIWLTTRSPSVMIAPQHQHKFHLSLFGALPVGRFHCSIEVLNDDHDIVATRRIRIQRFDRCFCLHHCLCACIASSKGLSCDQMSIEHFHAAGFLGSLPIQTAVDEKTTVEKHMNTWIYLLIAFIVVPLLLGLLKALLGCCCTSIGSAGTSMASSGKGAGEGGKGAGGEGKGAGGEGKGAGGEGKGAGGEGKGAGEEEKGEETGKSTPDAQEPNRCTEFFSNVFIFFFLIFVVISKLFKILFSIFCCGICQTPSDSETTDDSEPGRRKSILAKGTQQHDDDRHVSFDGSKGDGGGDGGDEDDDDDDDEEDENENNDEPDVLKFVGGEDLNEEEEDETDLLEYFDLPDALEGDQVKKIMKKFRQYYKDNPPDRRFSSMSGRDSSEEDDEGELSVYETKMAETFIELLLESEEVYRHFVEPVGDIIMPEGFEYCIRGFLVKSDTGYYFIPPSPLLQYWTHDKQLMEPPQPLAFADFERAYDSAVDVLISYDLDLMPNGPAVNVYHL